MSTRAPVLLAESTDLDWMKQLETVLEQTREANSAVSAALDLGRSLAPIAPPPGTGHTGQLWELLATIASVDLTVARVVEPHLDALAILGQAGEDVDSERSWGVFASEAPGSGVRAQRNPDGWTLTGTKSWCSLAEVLDCALITAVTTEGGRRLFAVELRQPGVVVRSGQWVARGLADVTSESIDLDRVPARAVGDSGWYLSREGFEWGGMGVAAVWFGAMVALGRQLLDRASHGSDDAVLLMLLGAVDLELHACRAVLASAAAAVDDGTTVRAVTAQRVRSTVSAAAERVTTLVGHGLGPGPLALDEAHARRVADLGLYVRQDHAERDLVRLGSKLVASGTRPW